MYRVRDDRVRELETVPPSDPGAPLPAVVADEHHVSLVYVISEPEPDWDGSSAAILDRITEGLPIAVVEFERPHAHVFGPPNDEAIHGHPLYERGLRPYTTCVVEDSSWILDYETMNSVHHRHRPGFLSDALHYIFAFHDSVFECIARGMRCATRRGTIHDTLVEAATRLRHADR